MSVLSKESISKRNIALDLMKVFGVLFITNAHSWDLWDFIDIRLAAGGAQGVTLFFFVSGFAMMIGTSSKKSFGCFVNDKIKRLWPAMIVWMIISSAFFGRIIYWGSFFALEFRFWFLSAIMIYYIICYYIVGKSLKFKILTLGGGNSTGNNCNIDVATSVSLNIY